MNEPIAPSVILAGDYLEVCEERDKVMEQRDRCEAKVTAARGRIESLCREALDSADAIDDEGGHVGTASYYRNVARGLGDALRIMDEEAQRAAL